MNPKIKKVIDDIERTKAKILELQTLLPELERKRIDMENTEIIKLVRSADILPAELPAFLESLKVPAVPSSASMTPHEPAQSSATEVLGALGDEAMRDGDYYSDDDDNLSTELVPED